MSAITRGLTNPFRNKARAIVVVALLSLVTGFLALLIQATLASRDQIAAMEGRVRTLIELREAGAFGTGGFGGDHPVGEEHFSTDTLDAVARIPHARHLARVDEYVYQPEVDASKKNAYAMVIGLHPGAALRAIGEVDYENARIATGRNLTPGDADANVAIVGRLYAEQRLGSGKRIVLGGRPFEVVGTYTTTNDFGDNHVFIPINAFRVVFDPGKKLSKIFVTVDNVANVERVVEDLKKIAEADVVTAPEAVSTARTTLGTLAVSSAYAAMLLFAIGAVVMVFIMVLSTRERIREIGTLKAIGASNREIVLQFLSEAFGMSALGAAGALLLALPAAPLLSRVLGVPIALDANVVLLVLAGSTIFAALGSLYPVFRGLRASPVDAMRRTA
ncbi:ABC transporter permease [Aromatoleum toluclasticum]|uniref:ABC transporter permease n=1 Tax=Aromatoleum toluclasticum TaxID=92003 RepID=UPI000365F58B|nr:ABC transporter permease [Aromatoleum toluclasticum]